MPKYVEIDAVERVNSRLDGVPSRSAAGDTHLFIRIEPYSIKLTGDDKKLYRHLRSTQGQGHGTTSPTLHPTQQPSPVLLAAGSKRTASSASENDLDRDPAQLDHHSMAMSDDAHHTQMQHMIGSPPKRQRTRVTSLTAMLQPAVTSSGNSVIVAPPSPSRKINRHAASAADGVPMDDPMTGVLDYNGHNVSPQPTGGARYADALPVPTIDLGPAAIASSSAPNPDALLLSRSPAAGASAAALAADPTIAAATTAGSAGAGDMAHKTLAAFIAAMNAAYPDFDFSDSPAGVFRPVTLDDVRASMHTHMAHDQEHELWDALNAAFVNAAEATAAGTSPGMHPWKEEQRAGSGDEEQRPPRAEEGVRALADYLGECEVYVFSPVTKDEDPLYEEGTIWSHTVLFFHRKLKRLALLKLRSSAAFLAADDDQSSLDMSDTHSLPIRPHAAEKTETGVVFAMDD